MSRAQLPLALKPPRRPRFDNFLPGPNQAVIHTLNAGLEAGGWYLLAGPAGSGRSHLLAATFAAVVGRGEQAQFVPLGESGSDELLAHAGGDWVMLDDIDALAGDRDGELALFNALNRWRSQRVGVLASAHGRDAFELPDLRSRLGQMVRLTLKPLPEAQFGELIAHMAAEYEVVPGRGVSDYLIRRVPRNAGRLARLVESAAMRALAERRTLSIPLVREVLDGE